MLPVRLIHRHGQWLAAGRFTQPAALDPLFAALLDTGTDYLLVSHGEGVVVAADPGNADPQSE